MLSIMSDESSGNIVSSGKELFEKLQREYFSLDEKSLKNIKKSVENAIESAEKKHISIVLATINGNILYLVIASGGVAVLKRGDKIGTIAQGEAEQVIAFSGKLIPDDTVILETSDFSKKVPIKKLSEILDNLEVSDISETLAPIIHENSIGTEAAVVLRYKKVEEDTQAETDKHIEVDQQITNAQEEPIQEERRKSLFNKIKGLFLFFFNKLPVGNLGRNKLILLAIVVLAVILFVSIIFETRRQENARYETLLAKIMQETQPKYDEALALIKLNKGLALVEFETLKKTLEENQGKLKEKSNQAKKLDEFIGKVENEIGKLSTGSTVTNQKQLFENVGFAQFKEETLVAINKSSGKIFVLSKEGESEEEFDTENKNVEAVAANASYIFLLGDSGITRTNKSNGSTNVIVENPDKTVTLDAFGNNLYGLSIDNNTIDKYQANSYLRSDYFTDDILLKKPISMTIDGSIWILDGGKIRKFTRGSEDNFTVSGLTDGISSDSIIFTSTDYTNLYILDKKTNKVISISKDGTLNNQYLWGNLSKSTSFAVDEKTGKVFVVIDNKLYSFDL